MHEAELFTDETLVRRLLREQFPRWASLPLQRVASFGTDHDIYRLGKLLAVRMPRIGWAQGQAELEAQWLPRLAVHLPLAVPTPHAMGRPSNGYPFAWSVVSWLPGRSANDAPLDREQAVADLAAFILALRLTPTAGAPPRPAGARGSPLRELDGNARRAIKELGVRIDVRVVLRAWEESLEVPSHDGAHTWVHGDLLPGNLLVTRRRLSAVIDFGGLAVGDPACDLQPAWHLFTGHERERFRDEMEVDEASWLRGRGWVLYQAVMALPYYWETNPQLVQQSSRALANVLESADER